MARRPEPSATPLAMGLAAKKAHCAVRFSTGAGNTEEDIGFVLESLSETLADTWGAARFVGCR